MYGAAYEIAAPAGRMRLRIARRMIETDTFCRHKLNKKMFAIWEFDCHKSAF